MMYKPKYLSYSGNKTFDMSPEEYYLKYACSGPRGPQTAPMAVGSAFDAFIKAELYSRLVKGTDSRMTKQVLFELQVESSQRTAAWIAGQDVYDRYVELGGLSDLMESMQDCIGPPNFELEITAEIDGVILLGKPDIHYLNAKGKRVIHDFKVMGYYSATQPGAKGGYICRKPGGLGARNCIYGEHYGHRINIVHPMNNSAKDWAEQLSLYAWILGEPIGGDYILTIDQICCSKVKGHSLVQHASCVDPDFQTEYFRRIKRNWNAIHEGHYFLDMTYEENLAKCATLDIIAKTHFDPMFRSMT